MRGNNTLGAVLQEGKRRLKAAGKENYAFEAELLLMEQCKLGRVALFTQEEMLLSPEDVAEYEGSLSQREANRPLQYILGQCDFMGLPFSVGEGVLIPRSDTEILVETVLELGKKEKIHTVVDLGTGSGCIPICLTHYGSMQCTGVDISSAALTFARKNAVQNKKEVRWLLGDLFSALPEREKGSFDAIISNPPYIAKKEIGELMLEVRNFEPHSALDGGEDGLDFYRRIVKDSPAWLKQGGWLFFEIGYDQGGDLLALMKKEGFCHCALRKDLAGLDRVVYGKLGEVTDEV